MAEMRNIPTSRGTIRCELTEERLEVMLLNDALDMENPHPTIIYVARYLVQKYGNGRVYLYIEKLANLDIEKFTDEVKRIRCERDIELATFDEFQCDYWHNC